MIDPTHSNSSPREDQMELLLVAGEQGYGLIVPRRLHVRPVDGQDAAPHAQLPALLRRPARRQVRDEDA